MWGNCILPGPFGRQIIIDVPTDSPGPVKQIANVVMKPGGDENKVVRMALDVVRTSGVRHHCILLIFSFNFDC